MIIVGFSHMSINEFTFHIDLSYFNLCYFVMLQNILCSDGLELLENGLCSNRSLIQPILPSTSNVPMSLVNTSRELFTIK